MTTQQATLSAVKERGILLSAPEVLAILDGHKTQTRRIVKPQADCNATALDHTESGACVTLAMRAGMYSFPCPYGAPGDRLWVRETFNHCAYKPFYRADGPMHEDWKWKPSIHMPRWASRITLEITAIRVEQLQDITEEDAKAEGCIGALGAGCTGAYRDLWDSINAKKYPWSSNPWVWVIEFRRITP